MERILFRFTKGDPVRFVGHLDLMRVFDRAMRRAGFPVAFSQGFNPRPRMAFASALTLGATSEWELCQLDLAEDISEQRLTESIAALRQQLPAGIEIRDIWAIPLEKRNPYIQVHGAEYEISFTGEEASSRLRQFFESDPSITGLPQRQLEELPDGLKLKVTLPVGERQGVRVRDLVEQIETAVPGFRMSRLHRTRLYCEQDPAARE